ncbi:MAG: cardiolipin synthase ClsB [Gallionellaceae bacterium]|nr:MAG: cardiolipin synthase ClsB [Gallionellaceae bacterium]
MSSTHEISGHRLALLRNGEEYFPHLLAAVHAARHSVYLEAYIFAADHSGRLLKDALKSAAARDVSVHVLLDAFGSANLPAAWLDEMRMLGAKVLWFRPELAWLRLRRRHLRRLHRKLVLVDEHIAFVGGINIIDDVPAQMDAPRLDYAVEVRGPVVAQIAHSMLKLWKLVSWTNFRRSGSRAGLFMRQEPTRREVVFLIRDNLRHRRDIEHAYLRAIGHAQHEIIIANAYFLPGRRFRRVLLHAARRGVKVLLLLQGKVEYRLQHYATLALYGELLQAGIEIHEYTRSFLHAKVAVVDGKWATVGSSNIDPFSLWLAREANLVVQDGGFAAALRDSLLQEMRQGARRVAESDWQRRNLLGRIVLRGSYALVRMLAGMTGYARKHDDI